MTNLTYIKSCIYDEKITSVFYSYRLSEPKIAKLENKTLTQLSVNNTCTIQHRYSLDHMHLVAIFNNWNELFRLNTNSKTCALLRWGIFRFSRCIQTKWQHMTSLANKGLTKHKSCECKCKFDDRKFISTRWWNNDIIWCECKKGDYIWNSATCSCEK